MNHAKCRIALLALPFLASVAIAGPAMATTPVSASFTAGSLSLAPPIAISFPSTTITGVNVSLYDSASADESLTVTDATGTGAGWNVTEQLTTVLTNGTHTIPAADLSVNGSTTSASATTAPTNSINSGGVVATNSVPTYPVVLSSGSASVVDGATVNTGIGVNTVANLIPWAQIPVSAQFPGTYSGVDTISVNSGPAA